MKVESKEFTQPSSVRGSQEIASISSSIDIKQSEGHTKGIFTEVSKETQSLSINKNSTQEVVTARKKVSSSLSAYKSALQKVKSYQSIKSPRQRRSARKKVSIPELTLQERKALEEFYHQFKELSQKKKTFFSQLKNVDPKISTSLEEECKSCKNIGQALKQIGWSTQQALNIFTKKDQKWKSTSPVPKANEWKNLWGDWDKKENPYSFFWDTGRGAGSTKDKWTSMVEKIFQNRKKYYSTVNSSSWRACGLTVGLFGADCGYGKKGSMEQEIKDSHSEIELTIANTLLNWMNQS